MTSSLLAVNQAPAPAESHRRARSGWLRAVVLGADDGIVSVASLAIGVVASGASHTMVVTAAGTALVAGAMSFAEPIQIEEIAFGTTTSRDIDLFCAARLDRDVAHARALDSP